MTRPFQVVCHTGGLPYWWLAYRWRAIPVVCHRWLAAQMAAIVGQWHEHELKVNVSLIWNTWLTPGAGMKETTAEPVS